MINIEIVKYFHSILIDEFVGSTGIRDLNALKAAIQRPYSTFDGKDLYPTIYDKAAALVESLVKNHAFIDGNKRIGYVMLRFFLMEYGLSSMPGRFNPARTIDNRQSFSGLGNWVRALSAIQIATKDYANKILKYVYQISVDF